MKHRGFRTGTSFAILCISGNYAYAYNIGNCKIFLFRDNRVSPITRNDTQAENLVMAKQIGADIARHTPDNRILTQYLGTFENEAPLRVHTNRISIKAGDKFLLCSDGLCDLAEDRIFQILSRDMSEQEIVSDLMNESLRGGGGENITAVVAGVNYADENSSKTSVLRPASDAPTHFSPIVFRKKFEFTSKHIKYGIIALAAVVVFIVAVALIFGGGGDNNDNNGMSGDNQGDPNQSDKGTGNVVNKTTEKDIDIPVYDPNATEDDTTEDPTGTEDPTSEDPTPAPTTTETPAAQPSTPAPTDPPTNPPPTDPLPTDPPTQPPSVGTPADLP
jgi:hypothetical protein